MPGGTQLCLGALLLGVLTLGVGPTNAHRLFENAAPFDCVTLNVAKMEQKDSKSQAVHVAARRAKANGIVKIQDINAKLVGTPFEQATERASLNWSLKKPGVPERMIDAGEMIPSDFPAFTRPFLKNVT